MNERAKIILEFWFVQSEMKDWFAKNDEFDNKIKELFFDDLSAGDSYKVGCWIGRSTKVRTRD